MSFVGIICTQKQEGTIKRIVNENLPNETIIILKQDNIQNFKNIVFDTIAIFSNLMEKFPQKEILINMIEKANYFVMNADEPIDTNLIQNVKGNAITYGFNTKSTITASSVKEDGILICIQRRIQNHFTEELEPQEILIPLSSYQINATIMMGIASILLIYGIKQVMIP